MVGLFGGKSESLEVGKNVLGRKGMKEDKKEGRKEAKKTERKEGREEGRIEEKKRRK